MDCDVGDGLSSLMYAIYLRSSDKLFESFMDECCKYYEAPVHDFGEMRRRDNKKLRGDIFENFCVLYLKNVRKYDNVYLLKDLPQEILSKLNLPDRDMGIDIVVELNGEYSAVQCKYRKRDKIKNVITWKSLSTFYGLCLRTGPWQKYIVITNCDNITHQGKKTNKDLSICFKTLQNISHNQWLSMCNLKPNTLQQNSSIIINSNINTNINTNINFNKDINKDPNKDDEKLNKDELRRLRILKYDT